MILLLSLFFNPSVLRTPPLYFAGQNTEEGEMYFPFASASILYVTPRNATGHGRGRGLIPDFVAVAVFQPLRPCGHLPYILLRKTQRRRVRCISLSLLLRFYIRHLVRLLGTAGEEF